MASADLGSLAGSSLPAGEVRAWDLPTRLFKWTFVVLVATAWLTNRAGDAAILWHVWNGFAILVLLCFRLLWGIFGSSTSRFSRWVSSPVAAVRYGIDLARGRAPPYLGHNPLGAWMIVALLALVASQGIAGLWTVDSNGITGGPFANLDFGDPTPIQRLFARWHHTAFNIILGFAAIHVAANLLYQFVKKDPVVAAMITGRKPARPFADERALRPAPATPLRAFACLGGAVAIVLGAVKLGGGSLPPLP